MNKYTYNDFKTLYFRKSKLTSVLQKLIDLVSGSSVLIKPYMEDENGCYNEGKTLSFIDDLMCALKTYLSFARATQIADYGEDDSDSDFYAVSQEEEMCYKGFIDCAVRVIYSNYLELWNQTFSSLVIMLDHTQIYRSYTELIKNLYMCKCQVKMTKNAHLKCTIMSEESVIRIIKDFSAFDAVGIAGNFDNFAVMNQTVNNGVCDDSIAKHIGPF